MVPYVRFGAVTVPTHSFFVTLGLVAALLFLVGEARRRGRCDRNLFWVALGALFFGSLGAKLSTVWRYVAAAPEPSLRGALIYGGKSIVGGLAGAYLGAVLTKKVIRYRRSTGDMFAPAVALGMAIGRFGCFFTEQPGTPTSVPWGIKVSGAAAARIPDCPGCVTGLPMHPSFLYEIAFQISAFAVLLWLRPKVRKEGDLFKIYLLGYAVFRFLVEFVRGNQQMLAGLTGPQLFLIPSAVVLGTYFWRSVRAGGSPAIVGPLSDESMPQAANS